MNNRCIFVYHLRSPHFESCSQSVTCKSGLPWAATSQPLARLVSCQTFLFLLRAVMNFPYSAAYCLKTTAINTQKWPYERNIRFIHG